MVHLSSLALLVLVVCLSPEQHPVNAQTPYTPPDGYELVWSDEFDSGSTPIPINSSNWNYEIGGGGWGNQELEYYTDSISNSWMQKGFLHIQALLESKGGYNYTSARITTKNKQQYTYGVFVAAIQAPYGQGIWPAFWMLGADIDSVSWPKCGEIDIFEQVCGGWRSEGVCNYEGKNYFTLHMADDSGAPTSAGGTYQLPPGQNFNSSFYIYELVWNYTTVTSSINGIQYYSVDLTSQDDFYAFRNGVPFYVLFNVAVGGTFGGTVDNSIFPQFLTVDWVRVYQVPGSNATTLAPTTTPPPTPGCSDSLSISGGLPSSVSAGQSYTLTLDYTACGNRSLVLDILQTSNYAEYGTGYVDVVAGSGAATLTLVVQPNAPAGSNYIGQWWMVDSAIYAATPGTAYQHWTFHTSASIVVNASTTNPPATTTTSTPTLNKGGNPKNGASATAPRRGLLFTCLLTLFILCQCSFLLF